MSVMQLLFLRCNSPGTSVATNTNSISTISRHILPPVSATKFTSWEKNSNPFIRIPRLTEPKNCLSKDELISESYDKWKCYRKSFSQPMIERECTLINTTDSRALITVNQNWLPISHELFYNTTTSQNECYPATYHANHSDKFTCRSEKKSAENSKKSSDNGLPGEDTLENAHQYNS